MSSSMEIMYYIFWSNLLNSKLLKHIANGKKYFGGHTTILLIMAIDWYRPVGYSTMKE